MRACIARQYHVYRKCQTVPDPILDNLNPQQMEAVTAPDGPVLVIAGAGSGKTRVITRRIAYLISTRGVRAYQVFAVTFTNKAAGEMKRRVVEMAPSFAADLHIGTFHSLCARILRREASAANLSRNFTICDERDQYSAVRHVVKALDLEKVVKPGDAQHVINQCKIRMLGPGDVHEIFQSHLEKYYDTVFEEYEKYMRAQSALDFEDLLLRTVQMFQQQPEILETYQRRYRHVLVDEYQDTNLVQFELVRLLAGGHHNLMVVGDEDQSIYSWRGAEIANLLDFEKHYPEARLIRLEQNYRSTGNILAVASALIANNTERHEKTLFTTAPAGEPVLVAPARSDVEEAYAAASTMHDLVHRREYSFRDCAVFYRMSALSRVFEDALRQQRIPYRVVGGIRFYDRAEIKDLISYLQVVANPGNSIALLRIINTPKRGMGAKSVQAVIDRARRKRISEYAALKEMADDSDLPRGAASGAWKLISLFEDWRELAHEGEAPAKILKRVLEDTGYIESLGDPALLDVRARTENIEELQNAVADYQRDNPQSKLSDYLEDVSLVSATDELSDTQDAVSLMTLHSAKGLEYKVVFIVGLEEGVFPNARAVFEEGRIEEERRLFYVGITRARELLVLSWSRSRRLYGDIRSCNPSSFVHEMPREHLQMLSDFDMQAPVPRELERPAAATPPEARRGRRVTAVAEGREADPGTPYRLGQRVRHPILGEGLITGISGSGNSTALIVQVDDRMHRLLAKYAALELLD